MIYYSGPLFDKAETNFNEQLCEKIEKLGHKVYLPQRDGVESNKPPYDKMTLEEKDRTGFDLDRDKILESNIFLIILDGRVPDEGSCVELGIAYSQKFLQNKEKTIIALFTDVRVAFADGKINTMVKMPLDHIAKTEEELLELLSSLKQ